MATFAFIFSSSAKLAPDVLATRNAAARDWVVERQREGSLKLPAPLEEKGFAVTRDGVAPSQGGIASVLVIDAPDMAAALALARTHPGLAYGTEIDVRPIKAAAAEIAPSAK